MAYAEGVMSTTKAKLVPVPSTTPGAEVCPTCDGKGEVRKFKMYVGCYSLGCDTCQGSGRVKRQS